MLPGGTFRIELFAFSIAALALTFERNALLTRRLIVPMLLVAILAALGLFQIIPMGDDIVRSVSPTSAKVHSDAREVLNLFGRTELPAPKISIAPGETVNAILLTLSYAAAFLSAVLLLTTRLRRRIFAFVICFSATLQIIIGMSEKSEIDRLSATFVNPNNFAGYLGLALAVAFGLIWSAILTSRDRSADTTDKAELLEKKILSIIPPILFWGLIAGGAALSKSRGGIMAALLTLFVLIGLAVFHQRRKLLRRRIAIGAVAAVVAGISFVAFSTGSTGVSRLLQTDTNELQADTRVETWKTSIEAWQNFPIFGSGLGAFKEAFRRVQPRELTGLFEYAHSDPLQILVSGGIIGFLASLALFVFLAYELLRLWMNQQHREESAMCLGAFGAILTLMLHGVVDFNLSIPAISVTLAMIAGFGWAAGNYSDPNRGRRTPEGAGAED